MRALDTHMNTGWAKIGRANVLRRGWEKREAAALGERCTDKSTICTHRILLPVPGACFDRANDEREKGCVFVSPNEGVSKQINVTIHRRPLDRYWYFNCENKVQEKFFTDSTSSEASATSTTRNASVICDRFLYRYIYPLLHTRWEEDFFALPSRWRALDSTCKVKSHSWLVSVFSE